MVDTINEEKSFWDSLGDSEFLIQWVSVLIIMGLVNLILGNAYGDLENTFFCKTLAEDGTITPKRLMIIFTFLIYAIIVSVREWTNRVNFAGTSIEQRKETFKGFIIYIIITLISFIYASAYIRRKFIKGKGGSVGGGDSGGMLSDTLGKVGGTGFGTLAIYVGIIIIIINIIINSYQYLKNKKENQKDNILRAIYFSQIANMFIFLVTSFFVAGFGCSIFKGDTSAKTFISALLRWSLVIGGSVVGIHFINESTGGENWFGDPK